MCKDECGEYRRLWPASQRHVSVGARAALSACHRAHAGRGAARAALAGGRLAAAAEEVSEHLAEIEARVARLWVEQVEVRELLQRGDI